jgi:hypothetical protein
MFKKSTENPKGKMYRVFQVGFFSMILLFAVGVWASYDYWIFRILISGNYVFTDALDELYARHLPEENRRGFFRDFDRVVMAVFTAELTSINNDRFTYLYTPQRLQAVRATDRRVAETVTAYALTEDTVRLFIPNVNRTTRRFVQQHADYLAQYRNLVLDLRGNYGGWLVDFHRIADLFLPRGAVIGYEDARLGLFSRQITSRRQPVFDFDSIVILQNHRTASAAEGLVQALAYHLPEVTIKGTTSFGKGLGQVTIPLRGGYALRASVINVLGPTRICINNIGIPPDIYLDPDYDWIAIALEYIARQTAYVER